MMIQLLLIPLKQIIYQIFVDRCGYAEVVSDMELYLARKVGFKDSEIYFNGPYKQKDVIEPFLISGGNVNVDSRRELNKVIDIANSNPSKNIEIGLRYALYIGQEMPSRFGFDEKELFEVIRDLSLIRNLKVTGIHTHLPFRSIDSFEKRTDVIETLLRKLVAEDINLKYLSIGGGYMGPMPKDFNISGSVNPTYKDYAKIVAGRLSSIFEELRIRPRLILEPGSALVANAMSLFARVENIKKIQKKTYITVIASTFNMNPTVKGLNRPITIHHAKEREYEKVENADIVGFTCIEGDCVYHDYSGKIAEDDYIEFHNVGSYSITMNPNFIRTVPTVIVCEDGKLHVSKHADSQKRMFEGYAL